MRDDRATRWFLYTLPSVELICWPERRSHKPLRNWKKSQKKIRRERRQRGYR